jgi:hypothetical protein
MDKRAPVIPTLLSSCKFHWDTQRYSSQNLHQASMSSVTQTISEAVGTLKLRPSERQEEASPVAASTAAPASKPKWYSETANEGDARAPYKYAAYLPTFDGHLKLPPLEPFEHADPGLQALNDPDPRSFLRDAEVEDITPGFATEVLSGVRLEELDTRGRQQLALFVAQRGIVVSDVLQCHLFQADVGDATTGLPKSRELHRQRSRLANQ